MRLQNIFLVKAFRQNKWLFVLFSGFTSLYLLFNYKGMEVTPFFVWAMFAGKMEPQSSYKFLSVTYNNGQVFNLPHTFSEPESMMVYFTLNHYRKIEANNMKDPMENVLKTLLPKHPILNQFSDKLVSHPADNEKYLGWLKNYLQSVVNEPIENMSVQETFVHFDQLGRTVEDSSKILYSSE